MGSRQCSTARNFIVRTVHLNIVRGIKSRRLRWSGNVARMEEDRSAFQILTGIRPRARRRWEDNIRMDLKEICINARNWID